MSMFSTVTGFACEQPNEQEKTTSYVAVAVWGEFTETLLMNNFYLFTLNKWQGLARKKLAWRRKMHVTIVKTKHQVIMKGWKRMPVKLLHQHWAKMPVKLLLPPRMTSMSKALHVPQLTLPGEALGEALFGLVAGAFGC